MKAKIAIIGKGNIGWAIKELLKDDYEIKHGDITEGLDARDIDQVKAFLVGVDAVISAGPFAINKNIGTVAAEMGIGYFDLTEDVETTAFIRSIKTKSVMAPQCGLAPGAINICASSRMKGMGGSINSYTYIKAIAEELRGLAVEFNVPIVSATQTTRSGFSNTDVGLEDTSESFGLPATADLMFALISTEELEELGQIMVKQLKNRYNDPTKYKRFVVGVDRSRMKLYDVEESAQSDIMSDMIPDKPINKFGERESNDSFADFKI